MNKYSGSNFDDFLEEEGILEEVSALAQQRVEKLDNTSGFIGAFLQWLQLNNQLVLRAASACVLIAIGVYLGSRYFDAGMSKIVTPENLTRENRITPMQVEPTFVRGVGKAVKDSPFDFGVFPRIPTDFPDQNIWNVVEKRSTHDPENAKTLELLARVRIKLWKQGNHTKGVIMDPSTGLIYPDSGIEILSFAHADGNSGQSQYDMYFDDGLIPLSVRFQEGGVEPYEFLNLPR